MTLDELLANAPSVLDELTRELFRRAAIVGQTEDQSQRMTCIRLGLRAASITHGIARVLDLHTLDSYETLNRAALEARDLLMYFRMDDEGIRKRIGYWHKGAKDSSWKPNHDVLDKFMEKNGAEGSTLGLNWSRTSVLAHPTHYAATNSTVVVICRMTGRLQGLSIEHKKADYVVGISRLIMATASDLPGWIPLDLDITRMPSVRGFSEQAEEIGSPIVNAPLDHPLPAHAVLPPEKI